MRLMLIGMDRTLFTEGTKTRARIAELGSSYTDALDTIVFSSRTQTRAQKITSPQKLAANTHAYATRSASRLFYGLDAFRIARKLPRPDVVSAQDPFETGLCAMLIAWYWKVPFAVEVHTDFTASSYGRHSLLNGFRVMLAGFVLRHASGGYTVSEEVREKLRTHYAHDPRASRVTQAMQVLPIYIDTNRFAAVTHMQHPRFKTALLWVGRMEEEKNPLRALEALAAARRAGYDVGLTFVGDGRLRTMLEQKVREETLSEWVEFVGAVADVAPHYAHADLLLVTSAYEGYGMVIVEALAAHVPVLSTAVGIAKEAGAIVVTNDTTNDFSDALCAWLAGERASGKLLLPQYKNEQEYFEQVSSMYRSITTV